MGRDIHGVFQKKVADRWVDVASEYGEDRDYILFNWLGLGGGDTYGTCSFDPLSQIRGLPDDFEIVDREYHPTVIHRKDGSCFPGTILMGEWGYSWLLASEILQTPAPRVPRAITISIDDYQQWDGISEPTPWQRASAYFGLVVGIPDKIITLAENVVFEWDYDFTEDFSYFVDEVRRLQQLHGEVRFVFGFA